MMFRQKVILPKLPRRHLLLKQNIQLLKRPPPTLRNAEPAPNKTNQTNPTKQKSRLASPIRLIRIQHIRHRHSKNDCSHRLDGGGDSDRSPSEARGGDFGDDDEADWSDGHLVRKGPDVH